jgi:hypothetical protein
VGDRAPLIADLKTKNKIKIITPLTIKINKSSLI